MKRQSNYKDIGLGYAACYQRDARTEQQFLRQKKYLNSKLLN